VVPTALRHCHLRPQGSLIKIYHKGVNMSRKFNQKNKDLVNLKVVSSKDVWVKNKKGEYVFNKNYNIFGKVDKETSSFVTNTNSHGKNAKFIEDTCNLPKNLKNDIVKHLYDKNKVAYLVKKK
jgi:hypothetical protein